MMITFTLEILRLVFRSWDRAMITLSLEYLLCHIIKNIQIPSSVMFIVMVIGELATL